MLRWYTRFMGTLLALLGLLGLLDSPSFDLGEALLFVATAPIFLYASLQSVSPTQIRSILGRMGVIYGVLGALVIAASFGLGGYSETRDLAGDLVHVALGVLCVCGALFLPCEDDEPPGAP